MSESFLNGKIDLHCGDMLVVLPTLAENSVDSCVCDPPYHLVSIVKRFSKMGENDKKLKMGRINPYQRTAVGFMQKAWDGGDIAFQVDTWAQVFRVLKPGAHLIAFSGPRTYHRMACAIEDAGFEIRNMCSWVFGQGFPKSHNLKGEWEGWGTDLKPAHEPICLARKPLSEPTIAANVLKWGTGALNIDACRVGTEDSLGGGGGTTPVAEGLDRPFRHDPEAIERHRNMTASKVAVAERLGRWPANIILDGSDEVLAAFPDVGSSPPIGSMGGGSNRHSIYGDFAGERHENGFGDSGSAARFFYTAKADQDDRLGSRHPTVKPLDLMQYLVRLVTPKGGITLDPFSGTGTTGEAAFREGFRAVLIEREAEYQDDIRRRMALALAGPDERARESIKAKMKDKPLDAGPLFGGPALEAE